MIILFNIFAEMIISLLESCWRHAQEENDAFDNTHVCVHYLTCKIIIQNAQIITILLVLSVTLCLTEL